MVIRLRSGLLRNSAYSIGSGDRRLGSKDEQDYETEALILFTEREAEHAYLYIEEKLKKLDPDGEYQLSYMNRDSQNFKKGLTVTTFYLAKGLEFDQVFGVFAADAEDGLSKQAKYIAATRALHELHMYD